jgi:hypothetical protein
MRTQSVTPEVLHVWAVCLRAGEEARCRGDRRAGTDHLVLALFEQPTIQSLLGVTVEDARQALASLDREALGAMGLGSGIDAPPLPRRTVPKKPAIRAVMTKDRVRMTPAAKRVLEDAVKPNRRKTQVTAEQVLAQLLTLRPPDPAAVLLDALDLDAADVRHRLNSATADSDH